MLGTKQMLRAQGRGGIDVYFIHGASSFLLSPTQNSQVCSLETKVLRSELLVVCSQGGGNSSAPQIHMDLYLLVWERGDPYK